MIHDEVLARGIDRPALLVVGRILPAGQPVAIAQALQLAVGALVGAAHRAVHAVVDALGEEQLEHELAGADDLLRLRC